MATASDEVKEKMIEALEAEELRIKGKATHQGFRDASRRNRIEEELGSLQENQLRDESSLMNTDDSTVERG
jgi:hypothetical protein